MLFTKIVISSTVSDLLTVNVGDVDGDGLGSHARSERSALVGLGLIRSASHFLATDAVFVGIGVIAALAFSFSLAMRLAERVLVPWKGKH